MYAISSEYSGEYDIEYEFSEEEFKLYEQRRQNKLNGESKTYSWQETKEIITGKKKRE